MIENEEKSYFRYWGKALKKEDGSVNYHLLPYHCLDVAAVGKVSLQKHVWFLEQHSQLLGIIKEVLSEWILFLLAIHDIGKFGLSFQGMELDLFRLLKGNSQPVFPPKEKHGLSGYRLLKKQLVGILTEENVLSFPSDVDERDITDLFEPCLLAVTGHHGRPPKESFSRQPLSLQFPEETVKDIRLFLQDLTKLFPYHNLTFDSQTVFTLQPLFREFSWSFAGLAVLCDWIGSNRNWFKYSSENMPLKKYWEERALPQAENAWNECGLSPPAVTGFQGIKNLFPDITEATPLQALSENIELEKGPHLFILEEVPGSGKTEAALTLLHRLMDIGEAEETYMALPTMATSNAMHRRVRKVYRKFYKKGGNPSLILAHGSSAMILNLEKKYSNDEKYGQDECTSSQECAAWLSDNRKKALLSHVGVGTIDQVLLAILANRYQSLRLFGLSRKVLIVDEVHACDAYLFRLLCILLRFHTAQGNSAILLSATLPQSMRRELLASFAIGAGVKPPAVQSSQYPLLTHLTAHSFVEKKVETRSLLKNREVYLLPLYSNEEAREKIKEALERGDCVCRIRNTVFDALEEYRYWLDKLGEEWVLLVHSRFILNDRLEWEEKVEKLFGVGSKPNDRKGRIVIATQVVEQSLDVDFDFMVTDLAPIDLIIQRSGRLQRHDRGDRGKPTLGVAMPRLEDGADKYWYKNMFPKGAAVYSEHGKLWLTARWIEKNRKFRPAMDSRKMVEYVYGEEERERIPKDLLYTEDKVQTEKKCESEMGKFNGLNWEDGYAPSCNKWEEDVFAPTRLGEQTVTLRLGKIIENELLPLIDEKDYGWQLSQLQIYRIKVTEESPANKNIIERGRNKMKDKGRYVLVIPLTLNGKVWEGEALDINGKEVIIRYDKTMGLNIKGGDEK